MVSFVLGGSVYLVVVYNTRKSAERELLRQYSVKNTEDAAAAQKQQGQGQGQEQQASKSQEQVRAVFLSMFRFDVESLTCSVCIDRSNCAN